MGTRARLDAVEYRKTLTTTRNRRPAIQIVIWLIDVIRLRKTSMSEQNLWISENLYNKITHLPRYISCLITRKSGDEIQTSCLKASLMSWNSTRFLSDLELFVSNTTDTNVKPTMFCFVSQVNMTAAENFVKVLNALPSTLNYVKPSVARIISLKTELQYNWNCLYVYLGH